MNLNNGNNLQQSNGNSEKRRSKWTKRKPDTRKQSAARRPNKYGRAIARHAPSQLGHPPTAAVWKSIPGLESALLGQGGRRSLASPRGKWAGQRCAHKSLVYRRWNTHNTWIHSRKEHLSGRFRFRIQVVVVDNDRRPCAARQSIESFALCVPPSVCLFALVNPRRPRLLCGSTAVISATCCPVTSVHRVFSESVLESVCGIL